MQTKRNVESPEFYHLEPLRMPYMRSQSLHPIPWSTKPTLRVLAEFNPPSKSTRHLLLIFLGRITFIHIFYSNSLLLSKPISPNSIIMPSSSPPLVPSTAEIIIHTICNYRVKTLKLRSSRLSEFQHNEFVWRSSWCLRFAPIGNHILNANQINFATI